jgi:two-component system sensor histidine kinase MprB
VSFRRRLVLATGAAVLVAILLASVAVYLLVRGELRSQVDSELRDFAGGVFAVRIETSKGGPPSPVGKAGGRVVFGTAGPAKTRRFTVKQLQQKGDVSSLKGLQIGVPDEPFGGPGGFAQVVNSKGNVLTPTSAGGARLPVTARTIAAARGKEGPFFDDTNVDGVHVAVYTRPVGHGRAVQAARSLTDVDGTLSRLTLILVAVCVGGVGLATGLGLLVGRTALRPVARLTAAAEHVARTRDLSRRIEAGGRDELARLARSFNTMLEALERSLAAQRQLVADASHELRTPLTSLRTNVEVLADGARLDPAERRQLLGDVVAQLEELTALVGDLVELAREEERPAVPEEVRFDLLVESAVVRARRHWPRLDFRVELEPCLVRADPGRLDRAVANLLANAAQWSPAEGEVEVGLADGELRVRDHGPGFAAADLEHVFDRFYRSPGARGRPGSGLGLAIVRQVAETHGGSVEAANAPGGGAVVRLVPAPLVAPDAPLAPRALTAS